MTDANNSPDANNGIVAAGDDASNDTSTPIAAPNATTIAAPIPDEGPRSTRPVAASWHTVVLLLVMGSLAFFSARSQHNSEHGRILLYSITIAWEWLMVGYIYLGIRKRSSLRELIGGRWNTVEDALLDVALGVGLYVVVAALIVVLALSMGMINAHTMAETKQKLGFIAPTTGLELGLFFALSATAGICEEIIFRGYFLRQFSALTRYAFAGVLLQGVLFGSVHAYEGGKRMAIIAVEGILFGAVTLWRRSIRPCMVAHFSQDGVAGVGLLLARHVLK